MAGADFTTACLVAVPWYELGALLKASRILPTVKYAVADNCEHEVETARSLLTGLGLPDFQIAVEKNLFKPFPAVCA